MSEELHKLQRIGAQNIYETTHIPKLHIQEILQSDFSNFSRVQFLGFISILEGEYGEDLSEHKAFGLNYFNELEKNNSDSLSIEPEEKQSKKNLYIGIVIVLFIVVVVLKYEVFTQEVKEIKVDNTLINTLIHNVKKTIIPKIVLEENNQTSELNTSVEKSQTVEITKVEIPEVKVVKSFKITTESKVWFGYIDMLTHKKRQKTFKGEFDLDPTKRWLLLFGHGFIDMYVNGEIVKFNSREYTRFIYEDGELRIIDKKEFNELNRGSQW